MGFNQKLTGSQRAECHQNNARRHWIYSFLGQWISPRLSVYITEELENPIKNRILDLEVILDAVGGISTAQF